MAHVDEILARLQAAQAHFRPNRDTEGERTLRVGVFQSVAVRLLPSILRRLRREAHDLRIIPVESTGAAALSALVERAELDVAFGDLPLESGPFASRTILRDSCALLVPAGSASAQRSEPLTIEELAQLPLIALQDSRFMSGLESWFGAQSLNPTFVISSDNLATVRAFVGAGLGAAIVPKLGLEPHDTTIAALDLHGLVPTRQVVLYWHDERPYEGALERFCEVAAAVALETTGPLPVPPLTAASGRRGTVESRTRERVGRGDGALRGATR
jgi:LysR family transcriptional regulator, hydrogen peroxide-inducible genes activator